MSKQKKINVGIIGATGYTGLDLVLMLSKHPKILIKNLCATKNLGKSISFFDNRIKKKLPKITSVKNTPKTENSIIPKDTLKLIEEAEKNKS